MSLQRGSLLNKRYQIVEILGQGGMGSVYRAIDTNLGMSVAVKENLFTTDEFARQFHREAIILAGLRHANLPRVTDHFVIEGQGQYLVMDYIEGEDLRERMDRLGTLSEVDVIILGVAICQALTYLHSCNPQVVHRDIKPGNVKITPSGHVCLVDFGLAKVVQGTQITTTGARAMTPGYSPPEQYGTARTDHRSDIYSLGATLYVALTGEIPEEALGRAMGQTELTPIRKHRPKVSRRLAFVIEKALELRPDYRYKSAEDFSLALINSKVISERRIQDDLTLTPPPASGAAHSFPSEDLQSKEKISQRRSNRVPDSNPSMLPVSVVLSEPVFKFDTGKRLRRKRSNYLFGLIFIILIIFGGLGLFTLQPEWLKSNISWLVPMAPGREMNEQQLSSLGGDTPTLTATTSPPTQTPQPTPSEGQSGLLAFTPTATLPPSEGVAVAETATPQVEAAITPTLVGGGSGLIAYASNRSGVPQIWLVNVDGSGQRQITEMPDGACQPAWSPDGSLLVFISPCASNQEIYPGASLFLINADGDGLIPLPSTPGGDFDPAWSPDGKQIAFTSLRDYNRAQIYVLNLEDLSVHPVSNNTVQDSQPAWSPDGKRLAFITTRRGPYQVWIMASDGSEATLFSRSRDLKNSRPVWSADGQVILFTQAELIGGVPRLIAVRLTSSQATENRVARDRTPMREGTYSPDGFWIVYEGWPDGDSHNIYIMTANGLARRQLTDEEGYDFDPAWRPAPED
jgi:eukaryotic-like serine/threonine-protein kinase